MKHSAFFKTLKTLKSQLQEKEKNRPKSTSHWTPSYTSSSQCSCTDSEGNPKYLYSSYQEIEYLLSSKEVTLYSYPCPHEKGWHLTKG